MGCAWHLVRPASAPRLGGVAVVDVTLGSRRNCAFNSRCGAEAAADALSRVGMSPRNGRRPFRIRPVSRVVLSQTSELPGCAMFTITP